MHPMLPAPELVNHLWQSTVFAAAVWLLSLALRKNYAHSRFRLWMLASVKFLVPFSLLIALGAHLSPKAAPPLVQPDFTLFANEFAQPFPQANVSTHPELPVAAKAPGPRPSVAPRRFSLWPQILLGLWAGGTLLLAGRWLRRWRAMRRIVRAASPLAPVAGVPVLSSAGVLEPGVFGILRPLLLLPHDIFDRLTPPQLAAIVEHEMCHVRRRDNLLATIHMVVEAVFWFFPVVWWIGARLIEERERACDEAVLAAHNDSETYAEGILKVCKSYVESPLACISGVTGSNLKARIVRIMSKQTARNLDLRRKLLLGLSGAAAIALPLTIGLIHARSVHAQSAVAARKGIAGTWQGTLHIGPHNLRSVLKIVKRNDGTLAATFYSIDQKSPAFPVSSIALQGSLLKFSIDLIGGSYAGTVSADGDAITGTWTQRPGPLPLNFARATPATAWTIPAPPPLPPPIPPMASDANPTFQSVTIKPSKLNPPGNYVHTSGRQFTTYHMTLDDLIIYAYGVDERQIAGAPDWVFADKYDITAVPAEEGRPNSDQWRSMLKKLLADRFHLKFHHEKKELAVYELTVAKGGPRLTKSAAPNPNGGGNMFFRGPGILPAFNTSTEDLAEELQGAVLDRPVLDHTGIQGHFDFLLKWTPDKTQFHQLWGYKPPPKEPADAPPDLYTALQKELGLKLEATKAPVDVLAIDRAEKP
jgi:uncharacterized protein (TIGR03435 family)